ncbi:Hypothetical protein RBRH_00248 (plasmid) [Mycetohabitans rhizoxinica HKI 454]|uniref:Uncharacterized protein n=1 Tax=Mycetohabitans rhizoxinica (strain DSM 19002 / CIP 109453 / HKI 454) TaxID=882378 RepID=E5AUV3_MYCRK|nr:Hypothetical protein RBRH_00248 [Mycetohabitans rhizoxinica HKI 454]
MSRMRSPLGCGAHACVTLARQRAASAQSACYNFRRLHTAMMPTHGRRGPLLYAKAPSLRRRPDEPTGAFEWSMPCPAIPHLRALALAAAVPAALAACVVEPTHPPQPALVVEVVPGAPAPGYHWVRGHYRWGYNHGKWVHKHWAPVIDFLAFRAPAATIIQIGAGRAPSPG